MTRFVIILMFGTWAVQAIGQQPPAEAKRKDQVPIYQVTVERRSVRALNYGYRNSEPTRIDFNGTVLLPRAHGDAKVESKAGAVEVDANFKKLDPPSRFGTEYLTYVLWAITPDGRPNNLGEIVTNGDGNGKLKVTTHLQAFGLIVTAEPYFSVTQPSNVVVLENMPRPGSAGRVQEVEAKYELLPRSKTPVAAKPVELQNPAGGRKISQDQYEAVAALYQAQNAVQIARSQGADRYAADTLGRAEELYRQAQQMQQDKGGSKNVVTLAREAAQKAEDARTIAVRRASDTAGQGARP